MGLFGKNPKRLKKIPSDLVPYIIIEGEAVKDANDKQLIVSYAMSKLDIVNWYIELLDCGTDKYIIPHSKEHLIEVKNQISAAVKTIMDRPIPSFKDNNNVYPPGYEG